MNEELSLCFWTDAPPLLEQPSGNSGIASQIAAILQERVACVLTRRFHRQLTKTEIVKAARGRPVWFYPDASVFPLRGVAPLVVGMLDCILFAASLPRIALKLRRSGVTDIFTLCGADVFFLARVRLMQMAGFATELYLVDEVEAATNYPAHSFRRRLVRKLIGACLGGASKVWTISEGFAEYLNRKYPVEARWLPVPSALEPRKRPIAHWAKDEVKRRIVFCGGINALYDQPLRDLYAELVEFNTSNTEGITYFLELLVYGKPEHFLATLPDRRYILLSVGAPTEERLRRMSSASACFLPYSFSEDQKTMVATSFSCKILEYYAAAVPILVYGPLYASIPRLFRSENLPFCATTRCELRAELRGLSHAEPQRYQPLYHAVWRKLHSPEAFKERISSRPQ
jgi:hypothetical protein